MGYRLIFGCAEARHVTIGREKQGRCYERDVFRPVDRNHSLRGGSRKPPRTARSMEEIDISSAETSPRTDDLVVCYRRGVTSDRQDTSRRFDVCSNATENKDGSATDDEGDNTKSSDRVVIVRGCQLTDDVNSDTSNGSVQRNLSKESNPSDDELLFVGSIRDLSIDEDRSMSDSNDILRTGETDLEKTTFNDKTRIKPQPLSEPDVNYRERIISVSPTIIYPLDFLAESSFFRWNPESFCDNSCVEYSGHYAPSLGYRPLKNISNVRQNRRITKNQDLPRTISRIKRPWFYEVTIEEEDGPVRDGSEEKSFNESDEEVYLPEIEITKTKTSPSCDDILIENGKDDEKDILECDSCLNSTESERISEGSEESDKLKDENILTAERKPGMDKSVDKSETPPSLQIPKIEIYEENVKNSANNKTNRVIKSRIRLDGDNKLSFITTTDSNPDGDPKCNFSKNKPKKGSKKTGSETRLETKYESVGAEAKKKLNVRLNIGAGSSSGSRSDLTSITPESPFRVREKRSTSTTPRGFDGQTDNRDAIRRQEQYILRHLELIRLGRLLLENPSEFYRRKSGKRKPSLFNNRKNISFSNDRLRDIEWANKVLLQRLVATSKRKKKK